MCSHSLLQGIFPTQGLNLGLLYCRQILYQLNHQESPAKMIYVTSLTSWHYDIRFDTHTKRTWLKVTSECESTHCQFSCSVVSDSLWPPWIAAHQASLSITNSWSLPKLMSIELVMPSNHLIPCHPLLLPPSIPASGSFPMSKFFASGGQSIVASASTSVLPMNTQDLFPLGWTGWISLQSKWLARVFSNTSVQSINSLALSFHYSPILTSIHDNWKNHAFDEMELCWQSNVSAF